MIDASPDSKTNKRCVVILGAGASRPFHVPAHDQLLDLLDPATPRTRHLADAIKYLDDENRLFKRDLKEIQKRLTQPGKKPNLETIFTVVRVLEAIDIPKIKILETFDLPHFREIIDLTNILLCHRGSTHDFMKSIEFSGSIEEFKGSIEELKGSIEEFKKYLYIFLKKVVYSNKSTRNSEHWDPFFDYCDGFEQVTWCSFNWDCILENSFYHHNGNKEPMRLPNGTIFQNSLSKGPSEKTSDKHTLLKLHGGINLWHEDNQNEIIYLLPKSRNHGDWEGFVDDRWDVYEIGEKSNGYPIILEPSAFKYEDCIYEQIKPHWDIFTQEMKKAHLIIIIGYSYPQTDSEMPDSPLKCALENVSENAAIVIIDPAKAVLDRYERVFNNPYSIQNEYDKVEIKEIEEIWKNHWRKE